MFEMIFDTSFYISRIIAKNYLYSELTNKGADLISSRNYEEALEVLAAATTLEPNEPEAYYNMGLALGNLGRYQEAFEPLVKAVTLKPDYELAIVAINTLSARIAANSNLLGDYNTQVSNDQEAPS